MKLFCLGFIFFVTQISFAQNVQLAIKDSSNQPIYGVIIYKNSLKIGSYFSDVISFDAKMNDTIQVKSNFYEDYEVVINEANFANDTLKMIINLAPKTRLLNEVIILAKETTTYYDVQNSFIIDYFPYGDLCFYATKEKGERYLQLNRGDAVIHKIKINFAPTEFYLDIFGDFHLLSKDSVYQIWSNETQLSWLNPISLDVFNQQIVPLVGKTDSCVFLQKNELANKFYTVNSIKNDT
jgi:REP element-mobilizing transposase RayT